MQELPSFWLVIYVISFLLAILLGCALLMAFHPKILRRFVGWLILKPVLSYITSLVFLVVMLRESEVSDEIVRSIFESEIKDLKTKAFEYFLQIFSERHSREEAEKISRIAVSLIEPLTKKQEEKVKETIEELAQ